MLTSLPQADGRAPALARHVLRLFVAVQLALPAAAAQAQAVVEQLRFGVHSDFTRIVIESNARLAYAVVLDVTGGSLRVELPPVRFLVRPRPAGPAADPILGFDYTRTERGATVAFGLQRPVRIAEELTLPPEGRYGHRIVLDVVATGPPYADAMVAQRPSPAATPQVAAAPQQTLPSSAAAPPSAPAPAVVVPAAVPDPPVVPVPAMRPPAPVQDAEVAALPAATPVARALHRPTIVIDAGHGGIDPGAIGGRFDTAEKELTLRAARLLQDELQRSGRYRVVLTRTDDSYLPLRERLQRARDAKGDLLISLHADSLPNHAGHGGASVYTLSTTASDKEAQRLATRENDTDSFADTSYRAYDAQVVAVLADLAMRDAGVRSEKLAEVMASEIGRVAPVVSHARRSAGFVVLMSPEMPSVLVEMGYLSNATDEKRLRSDAYLRTMAAAIARAVDLAVETNLLLTR